MDIQMENFIKLISSYINKTNIDLTDVDWDKIIDLAKIHNLYGIIYLSIINNNIPVDENLLLQLKKKFFATVNISTVQDIVTEELIALLKDNNIRHIVFKGYVLKNYYPHRESRTMGDVDIVIDEENTELVHKILMEAGFEFDELSSKEYVRNYSKNKVCFEIHKKIIGNNIVDGIDFIKYFEDNFKYAHCVKDCTYEFNKEHHLIYLMSHMAKHFKYSGCGIRMVIDIPVFVNCFKDETDWKYVERELDKLKLLDFSKNIFSLCREWFNTDIPIYNTDFNEDNKNIIGKYILDGGVFGEEGKNTDAIRINSNNNSSISRIINLIKLVFPSYEKLKTRYVWVGDMPKWLLPVGWVRLWWFRIFKNKENSFGRIKTALASNDDAKEHNKLMDIVGLKR